MRFARNLIFGVLTPLLLLFFLLSSTNIAHAQTTYQNPYVSTNTEANVPQNLHTLTQNLFIEAIASSICIMTGTDPLDTQHGCLGIDPSTNKIGYVRSNGGLIGFTGSMIQNLYVIPAHTSDFIAYTKNNFGIVKQANAATPNVGYGFANLGGLLDIWVTFRNIAYILIVIVFVVIGLAIMLRFKVDPRTVMTIQNQIPKIIVTLILITLSFAIAGLLIDAMYVVIYLVYGIIAGIHIGGTTVDVSNLSLAYLQSNSAIGAGNGIASGGIAGIAASAAGGITGIIQNLLQLNNGPTVWVPLLSFFPAAGNIISGTSVAGGLIDIISNSLAITAGVKFAQVTQFNTPFLGDILNAIKDTTGGWLAGAVVYEATEAFLRDALPFLIPWFIIMIAVLFALFRVWFMLLSAYALIIFDIIFAPLWIVLGLIPGSSINFTAWLKHMLAQLMAFPLVIAMFLIASVLMDVFSKANGSIFVPPLIGNPNYPGQNPIGSLLGLGILLMTPQVTQLLQEILKAPSTKATGGIGQALGAGAGVYVGSFKNTGNLLTARDEAIMRKGPGGQFTWMERGPARAFWDILSRGR